MQLAAETRPGVVDLFEGRHRLRQGRTDRRRLGPPVSVLASELRRSPAAFHPQTPLPALQPAAKPLPGTDRLPELRPADLPCERPAAPLLKPLARLVPWCDDRASTGCAVAPPLPVPEQWRRCFIYGNRNREVVQRREGVRLHHPG